MRVVGGKWKGRNLASPAGPVRPTTEQLRDAWISLLEPELDGTRVLDLFAGSGALGVEALSRGARYVDFVERHPAALHALKANVAALRVRERSRIFKRDAIAFARGLEAGRYDIALADPPYGSREAELLVEQWRAVSFATVLCVEHATDHPLPRGDRTLRLGEQSVTFYRVKSAARAKIRRYSEEPGNEGGPARPR